MADGAPAVSKAQKKQRALSPTQRTILNNVMAGRNPFHGMPGGRSAAGGWDSSLMSLYRRGLLRRPGIITDAGIEVLS